MLRAAQMLRAVALAQRARPARGWTPQWLEGAR